MGDTRTYELLTPQGERVCDVVFGDSFVQLAETQFLVEDSAVLQKLVRQIQEKDYQGFDKHEPDILPYYCRQCGRLYAQKAWRTFLNFDGDFLDDVIGTCPLGHHRMMSD